MRVPLDGEQLLAGFSASRIVRAVHTYNYEDYESLREGTSYLVRNDGPNPISVVSLPPRVMELQVDMVAELNGSREVPIAPSGEIRSILLEKLREAGYPDDACDAFDRILAGGDRNPREDDQLSQDVEDCKEALRGLSGTLSERDRGAFNKILREAGRGKYMPFIVLPEPLEPDGIASIDFQRTRHTKILFRAIARGFLLGRFNLSLPLAIGTEHSTHIRVRPADGTQFTRTDQPEHWPRNTGTDTESQDLWNIYLDHDAKKGIWFKRDKMGAQPGDDAWPANIGFGIRPLIHAVLAASFGLLAVGPYLLVDVAESGLLFDPSKFINVLILIGGIFVPFLLAHLQDQAVFHYLGFHALLVAVTAIGWLSSLMGGPTPMLWLWLASALGLKEAVLAVWSFIDRLKYSARAR